MINRDPSQRPSAVEALEQFREIRKDVWTMHRLWRARVRDEPLAVQAVFDTMTPVSSNMDGRPYGSHITVNNRRQLPSEPFFDSIRSFYDKEHWFMFSAMHVFNRLLCTIPIRLSARGKMRTAC